MADLDLIRRLKFNMLDIHLLSNKNFDCKVFNLNVFT